MTRHQVGESPVPCGSGIVEPTRSFDRSPPLLLSDRIGIKRLRQQSGLFTCSRTIPQSVDNAPPCALFLFCFSCCSSSSLTVTSKSPPPITPSNPLSRTPTVSGAYPLHFRSPISFSAKRESGISTPPSHGMMIMCRFSANPSVLHAGNRTQLTCPPICTPTPSTTPDIRSNRIHLLRVSF